MTPPISVMIPAHNEAGYIDRCLLAVLASDGVTAQVVVVANGCRDDTAARARAHASAFAAKGWGFEVLDLQQAGKPGALNTGDSVATHGMRAYLDADVTVSPQLLAQIARALSGSGARYASGRPVVARAGSAVTRAYARFWTGLPFVTRGVPGFGIYAVNAEGRARWGAFPKIISDDTFARLSFTPDERHLVNATYEWPMVEGFARLVRVRRRQDQGVAELARLYPELMANEGANRPGNGWLLRQALRDPVSFATYAAVSVAVRLRRNAQSGWVRGR